MVREHTVYYVSSIRNGMLMFGALGQNEIKTTNSVKQQYSVYAYRGRWG